MLDYTVTGRKYILDFWRNAIYMGLRLVVEDLRLKLWLDFSEMDIHASK